MCLIFHKKKRRGGIGNVISGRVWQESSPRYEGSGMLTWDLWEPRGRCLGKGWATGVGEREEGYLLRDAEHIILGGWRPQRDFKSVNNIIEECLDGSLFSSTYWLIHRLIHTKETFVNNSRRPFSLRRVLLQLSVFSRPPVHQGRKDINYTI